MWAGGIANPLSVIEQLTYLLFINRLDELHTLRERKATRTGEPIEEPIFRENQDALRWKAQMGLFTQVKAKCLHLALEAALLTSDGGKQLRKRCVFPVHARPGSLFPDVGHAKLRMPRRLYDLHSPQ